MHKAFDLIQLFERCFFAEFNTRLEGGAEEPLYLPTTSHDPARILFTRDYFASALHEVAHWCVAGEARRQGGVRVVGGPRDPVRPADHAQGDGAAEQGPPGRRRG